MAATDNPKAINKVVGFDENLKKQQQSEEAAQVLEIGFGFSANGCEKNEKRFVGFAQNEVKEKDGDDVSEVGFAENVEIDEEIEAKNEKDFVGFKENGEAMEVGDERGFSGFGEDKEKKVKKVRRVRRKGKGKNKCARTDGIDEGVNTLVEKFVFGNGYEGRSDRVRNFYSRKEMEDLRFVNVDDQKRKWVEVYCGVGPVLAKEYDCLAKSHCLGEEQTGVDFDPRKNVNKSFTATEILDDDHFETLDNEMKMNPSDSASCVITTAAGTVVEEEYTDGDDSDSEYSSIQRPAFMVTGEPDFDAGPAQDGLEYLRRVRWETEHVQKVTFAKIEERKLNQQTVYIPKIPDIARCPEQLMPLKEWESAFLIDFSELRLAFSQNEDCAFEVSCNLQFVSSILEDDYAPRILEKSNITEELDRSTNYGNDSPELSTDSPIQISAADENEDPPASSPKAKTKVDNSNLPTISSILGMDPVARVSMLKKRIKLFETMTSLAKNDCAWLFALCATIDTPLYADTSASLRDLLRKCASLRAEKTEVDDEVVMLNILATISGKYFGQSEN